MAKIARKNNQRMKEDKTRNAGRSPSPPPSTKYEVTRRTSVDTRSNVGKPSGQGSGGTQQRIGNSSGSVSTDVKRSPKHMGMVEEVGQKRIPTAAKQVTKSTVARSALGRAGAIGAVAATSWGVMEAAGDMYVDKVKKDLSKDRVKLTAGASSRVSRGETNNVSNERKGTPKPAAKSPAPSTSRNRKEASYDNGGVREGRHAGIGDDTRARAMAFVTQGSEDVDVNSHKDKGSFYHEREEDR